MTWKKEDLKPTLDHLLDHHLPVSPPIEIEIGKNKLLVCFRALTREQVELLKMEARRWVVNCFREMELPESDLESMLGIEILGNETDLRLLEASCCDPDSPGGRGPAFSVDKMRKTITPQQQNELFNKWNTWQTAHGEINCSNEQIDEMIEAARERDFFTLLSFGSAKLGICITTMADHLETLQINKSSDGQSSEKRFIFSELLTAENQNEINLQSLSTMYLELLDRIEKLENGR